MPPIDFNQTPKLSGVVLATAGTPTYSPTLTVQGAVVEALSQGHRVVASSSMAKLDPHTDRRFPRIFCSKNPRGLPLKAYIENDPRIVELTPWPVDDVYIFVEKR